MVTNRFPRLVTPMKKRSLTILTFSKRTSRHSSEVGLRVAAQSRHHLLTVFRAFPGTVKNRTCQNGSTGPGRSTVGREALLFSIILALRYTTKMHYQKAERLSAMADSVRPSLIRSYHCHESGCYAKEVFSCRARAHVEGDRCVYNSTSMAEWFGHKRLEWFNTVHILNISSKSKLISRHRLHDAQHLPRCTAGAIHLCFCAARSRRSVKPQQHPFDLELT
jgi:hypothetical protein